MRVLKDPRLWVALGVLSLSILIWVVGGLITVGEPAQPLPLSFRLVLLGILYITVAAVWLVLFFQAKRTNAAMLGAMGGDQKVELASVAVEEKQLKEKFTQAMGVLKDYKFVSKQGKRQLFQLPWYIVIGSPGSGKTTAIANSGLEFPLSSVIGTGSLTGAGGTRNCDWWITSDAVLLDTAGRYTTQNSNQAADAKGWNNFLELLRTNRKRQPINGAVIVLSVDEVLNYSSEQWQQHLQTIKSRLNELVEKLNQTFPTYLVLTKMDLLSGFREFFDTLDTEEQGQVWGATLPMGVDGTRIGEEISLIAQRLHEQLPHKLKQERDIRRRQAIFHFPWQFEQLKARLQELTNSLFSKNAFALPHDLRGIYFTSAVQQGSPIERLFAGITSKFGISGSLATAARGSRTLFLKQVFQQVIFPEAVLATTNAEQDKRISTIRMASMIASVVLGAVLLTVWVSGYLIQNATLAEASERVDRYLKVRDSKENLAGVLKSLKELEAAVAVFDQRSHPLISSLGMYDAAADEAARAAYKHALQQDFLQALAGAFTEDLASTSDNFSQAYALLKGYLMLSDLEHRDREYLVNTAKRLGGVAAADKGTELLAHFEQSLYSLDEDYRLMSPDQELIDNARALLSRITPAQRVYWRMQEEYAGDLIDLRQELGSSFAEVFSVSDGSVLSKPTFFTRQVYEKLDFSADSDAMKVLEDDEWVLGVTGKTTVENLDQIAADVKKLYIADYTEKWASLYRAINLTVPGDINSYVNVVGKLADPVGSPLLRLAMLTARETDLPKVAPKEEKLKAIADKLLSNNALAKKIKPAVTDPNKPDPDVEPLRIAFGNIQRMSQGEAASKSSQMILTLGELRQWLSGIYMSADAGAAALQTIEAGGVLDPSKRLLVLSSELPPPYGGWMASLARNAQSSVSSKATGAVSQSWKSEVGDPCKEKFAGKFPFVPTSKNEASIAAISEFFKPGGIEDNYVKQNVKKYLNKPGSSIPSSGTRAAIKQAQTLRETLFNKDGGALGYKYTLTPVKMDQQVLKVSIEIAGGYIEYSHGPKLPTDLMWPDDGVGITVTFQLADGRIERKSYPGPWALHHLAFASKGGAPNQVTFSAGLYSATFRIGTTLPNNPFSAGVYSAYQCRDSI